MDEVCLVAIMDHCYGYEKNLSRIKVLMNKQPDDLKSPTSICTRRTWTLGDSGVLIRFRVSFMQLEDDDKVPCTKLVC